MSQLNTDLLRTFVAVAETASITEGAARIFRSQSAASLQIRKLEQIVGQPVFDRHGRGVVLTLVGERLLLVARDVTLRLDSALREITADTIHGKLRLGIPDDQSRETLSRIVAEFSQRHPRVELEVLCDLGTDFPKALGSGALDLAVYEVEHPPAGAEVLRQDKTFWMASRHHSLLDRDPIPVALFDRACWWRDAALKAIRASGRPYRVIFSSQSVAGVVAAIEAGVAIGLLAEGSLTESLRLLGPDDGFGEMPVSHLVLEPGRTTDDEVVAAMQRAIRRAFRPQRPLPAG